LAGFSGPAAQALVRAALWLLTIAIALAPPLFVAGQWPSLAVMNMARAVNHDSMFRDFFYVVIVASVIPITNVWERLVHDQKPARVWVRAMCVVASAFSFT
jgi:hypothetical protein